MRRARLDAARESLLDCRLGDLHVGRLHDYVWPGHRLNEIGHADEHVIGLPFPGAMVDQEYRVHTTENAGGTPIFATDADRRAIGKVATELTEHTELLN